MKIKEFADPIIFRQPVPQDGAAMYKLVKECGVLDTNSEYCYLMLCKYFAGTCVVAEVNGEIAAFVTAFQQPTQKDCIFIWQIAVSSKYRGSGIGTRIIDILLTQVSASVQYIEATISHSNTASKALFNKITKTLGSNCVISQGFERNQFTDELHEAELLYRIGPFTLDRSNEQLEEFKQ